MVNLTSVAFIMDVVESLQLLVGLGPKIGIDILFLGKCDLVKALFLSHLLQLLR